MIMKKKDAVEQLIIYKGLLKDIFNKPCIVTFDMHKSSGFIITDIKLQTLTGIKNKPDKVVLEDGKKKSPMLFVLENNQAPFIFTIDDATMVGLGNGVRITIPLDKPLNGKSVMEIDIRLEG